MSNGTNREPMLEMYIFETTQLVGQLEQSILNSEKAIDYELSINEMFRVMHTIKGNSAMMLFNNISELAHLMEDLFDFIRVVFFEEGCEMEDIRAFTIVHNLADISGRVRKGRDFSCSKC